MQKEIISKEEFVEWVNHPLTKKIQRVLVSNVQDQRVVLSRKIFGTNERELMYKSGYIDGVESTLDFKDLFDFGDTNKEEED